MAIGFHASHEQFAPSELIDIVREAEACGFTHAMSSDHSAPWSVNQGHSGFTWSWLGAAMQVTNMTFGSLAIPGGWRYHPVVLAQAVATLAEMFPHRLPWIAAGSGEALNEIMVGQGWPDKEERNSRLFEGVEIMRSLWRGETVTKQEGYIKAEHAKLWSLPVNQPKIYGAALTPQTAGWMGGWADGLITVRHPAGKMKEIINAFHDGGGKGKPIVMQMHVSWHENEDIARHQAWHQWKSNTIGPEACANFRTTEDFDEASKHIPPDKIDEHVMISADAEKYIAWIDEYTQLGANDIFIHNAGKNQKEFIRFFGREVLPKLAGQQNLHKDILTAGSFET